MFVCATFQFFFVPSRRSFLQHLIFYVLSYVCLCNFQFFLFPQGVCFVQHFEFLRFVKAFVQYFDFITLGVLASITDR